MVDVLLAVLYPPQCPLCGRPQRRPGGVRLCSPCRAELGLVRDPCARCAEPASGPLCKRCKSEPPPFRRARACSVYAPGSATAAALLRWKYRGDAALGRALCQHFAARLPHGEFPSDIVVPVPMSRPKLRRRGFNQAALLAAALADRPARSGRLVTNLLTRADSGKAQAMLGRVERARLARSVFASRAPISGLRVLLVDDVLTTGETAAACTRTLLAAGAREVEVAVFCRTPASTGSPLPTPPESPVR